MEHRCMARMGGWLVLDFHGWCHGLNDSRERFDERGILWELLVISEARG